MFDRFIRERKAATVSQPFALLALVLLLAVLALSAVGCGSDGASGTTTGKAATTGASGASGAAKTGSQAATGTVVFHGASGDATLDVEVARTTAEKSKGLMNRGTLGADSGMIFVWDSPIRTGFWMKDTPLPLSIAFIDGEGTIIDIQEMEAQSLNQHAPGKPYMYAVEASRGYYAQHGIKPGDMADIKI